jgi:hypothetical protein
MRLPSCIRSNLRVPGAAGKITVSEAIYHRTKDLFDFEHEAVSRWI